MFFGIAIVVFAVICWAFQRNVVLSQATGHSNKFGTIINCIDGRVQAPAAEWLKNTYHLAYVDTITEPGPDKAMVEGPRGRIEEIEQAVRISVNAHLSPIVAIAGHDECAANPVDKATHLKQIKEAVKAIESWNLPVKVVGLWVGHEHNQWKVEPVEKND